LSAATRAGGHEPALALTLQRGARVTAWPVATARLRRWVRMALGRDAAIALRLVARAEAVALNRSFRGRDYAPNVLTFAYGEPARGRALEADVVICVPVVRAEARAQRKPFDHHLAHMVVHGVLHAQGHDHVDPGEAAEMEALETRLLARLRIPDPYACAAERIRVGAPPARTRARV
jgi:probable rRNA maturation factor